MTIKTISFFVGTLALAAVLNSARAQTMSSPYTVYGIGDINHRVYNLNAGMGYTGVGLKTTLYLAGNNPASVAGLEKSFFLFNASAAGKTVTYAGTSITSENSKNNDFSVKGLSMATKLTSFWGSSIGFSPFSTVSYKFASQKVVEGTANTYSIHYTGDGGLNKYYWNNGFNVGKHLSAGITTSFIAGPVNQTETLVDASENTIESKRRDYYGNGHFEYGVLYNGKLSKKWDLSLGGSYAGQTKMNYERTLTVDENGSRLVDEDFLDYRAFSLPTSYKAGVALSSKSGTTLAADYAYDDWNALAIRGTGWRMVSSNRLSVGVDLASVVKSYFRNTEKRSFQLGAFINNSPLQVKDQQIVEYGFTGGLTRSLKSGLLLGAALEGGVRGTTRADLIRENYAQLTFTLSYRDFFNSKGIKYR